MTVYSLIRSVDPSFYGTVWEMDRAVPTLFVRHSWTLCDVLTYLPCYWAGGDDIAMCTVLTLTDLA